MRKRILREIEEGVDTSVEGTLPLITVKYVSIVTKAPSNQRNLLIQILDILDHILVPMVIHQCIDANHGLKSGIDHLLAVLLIPQIDGEEVDMLSRFLDASLGLFRIRLFLRQIRDQACGTLHGEQDSNSSPDTRVSARDNSPFSPKFASRFVCLISV